MSDTFLIRTGLGQDSHRFETHGAKPLILAGCTIPDAPGLAGNSDADLIFHVLTNAISGISGQNILGPPADAKCKLGITDSRVYLADALKTLAAHPAKPVPVHVSLSIEGRRPKLWSHLPMLKEAIAEAMILPLHSVGLTATTGEGLTDFGRGDGLQALCILTTRDTVPITELYHR